MSTKPPVAPLTDEQFSKLLGQYDVMGTVPELRAFANAAIVVARLSEARPAPDRDRQIEVLRAERDHARARLDRAVQILVGINALIYPGPFKLADGRTMVFHSPILHEQFQALSDRIRAIPDEIAALSGHST